MTSRKMTSRTSKFSVGGMTIEIKVSKSRTLCSIVSPYLDVRYLMAETGGCDSDVVVGGQLQWQASESLGPNFQDRRSGLSATRPAPISVASLRQ